MGLNGIIGEETEFRKGELLLRESLLPRFPQSRYNLFQADDADSERR